MRSMITQARVAAGVPTGGEFTSRERAESSVMLAAEQAITARTPLDPRAAVRFAQQVVAGKAARYRIYDHYTLDDITQNAILSVLGSLSRDRVDGLTGGLIANAVSHAMSAAVADRTGVHRPEDVKALRTLNAQIEKLTHELGREPTSRERDELAEQIRDSWPDPRHRPLVGYQAAVVREVLERSRDARRIAASDDPAAEHDGSEDLRNLEDDLAAGAVTKEVARLRLWNAVAKAEGLPLINRRLSPGTPAAKHIKAVTRGGGPLAIAEQFLERQERTPEFEALMYPFDVRSRDDAIDIARLFVSRGPAAAAALWRSATYAAARPTSY